MKTKKIVYGGVLLAMGILLPQMFHLTGVPQSGAVFLPMHIPVILAGYILGPWYGLAIGILSPTVSSFITGMPAFARLPFMIGELAGYGVISGLLFQQRAFYRKKFGIYTTLLLSMAAGRIIYALMLFVAADLLHIPCGGPAAAIAAVISGIPGIIVQLVLIPAIIYLLRKGGALDGLIGTGN